METFNVLDPQFRVNQPFLLEASAGTGKTFSIENIVFRAVVEEEISIKDLLVVTFTKAAAKELKIRIFNNLQKNNHLRRVKRALVEFDQAHISTIHAFCYRALSEHATTFRLKKDPEELSQEVIWKVLEKHFHTNLRYNTTQINILLKNGLVKLSEDIIHLIHRGLPFFKYPVETPLKLDHPELLEKYAPHYCGLCEGTTKHLRPSYSRAIHELRWEELKDIIPLFAESNLKKRGTPPPQEALLYFAKLQVELVPPLFALYDYDFLLSKLADECQQAVFAEFETQNLSNFSYLLMKMDQLVATDPDFKARLKKRYKMVIIDEFQDTDPLQWKIFKELFADGTFPFILVGDPKQSIYAFRSADIYTYLDAANCMPSRFLLNTNYRSTPELISALNYLFSSAPEWMRLPHLKTNLDYRPVSAPPSKEGGISPAVHFLHVESHEKLEALEEKYLFPYYLEEIQRLQTAGISLSSIAFLVRNKNQSARLFNYFQFHHLPAIQIRSSALSEAEILQDLIYLMEAIEHPKQITLVQTALGTIFFRLKPEESQETLSRALVYFNQWHHMWKNDGVVRTIESVLSSCFLGDETVQEKLLQTQEGIFRYQELRQLVEWLGLSGNELKTITQVDIKLRPLACKDAVQILTLHMSKGLEFEVVFAPGVAVRSPTEKGLILARHEENLLLKAALPDDPAYFSYLEECDAEKARQLYVALTRAKSKLYIPLIEGWKAPSPGTASPLELWLTRFQGPLNHPHIAIEKLVPKVAEHYLFQEALPKIFPPGRPALNFPKIWNLSYSGLSRGSILNYAKPQQDDILPLGTYTGQLLHLILEKIPFSLVKKAKSQTDLHPFIFSHVAKTLLEPWVDSISEMIYKAFKTPILGFTLDDLTEETSYREMEFVYPISLAKTVPECKPFEGTINGVIDLFFTMNDKFYLLDWKSNWLESYDEASLKKAMEDHRYDLQADLYKRGMVEYLSKFSKTFGGTIYYFLRGNAFYIYGH